ncbi:unnamed protein product [Nezara viridula]|uniref:GH26 domain-containing protein n=1 Tax=Nezara viridula TaxID=85310 RepID=A0A9P0E342_NEZVI|nr:unnamed protein product [Nezara viridula]
MPPFLFYFIPRPRKTSYSLISEDNLGNMEMRYILFTAFLCHAAVSIQSAANPRANENTKKLLAAMSNIGDRILSGAFGGYNRFQHEIGFSMNQANQIKSLTNKLPAVYGIDCSPGWAKTAEGRETDVIDCYNSLAVDYAKKGGIITVSHHIPNPVYPGNNYIGDGEINNSDYAAILQDGTPIRNRWLKTMEKIAEGLQQYKNQGITILYRPFHEMNGPWFWWSAMKDETQNEERKRLFKMLWKELFNFMANKGLDNILWVYSPDQSRESRTAYYPGDEYVDIVGLDWYSDDPNQLKGYDEMTSLGKPFTFAEVGPYSKDGQFDYDRFMKIVASRYPKAIYFMPWNAEWSPIYNKNPSGAYNHPKVMNLGELKV